MVRAKRESLDMRTVCRFSLAGGPKGSSSAEFAEQGDRHDSVAHHVQCLLSSHSMRGDYDR